MSFRTRLAFMVILLLLGCVFAAPFYHSAISPAKKSADSETSLPTLQIQRDAGLPKVEEAKFEANTISSFPIQSATKPTRATPKNSSVSRFGSFPTSQSTTQPPDRIAALSVEPIPPLNLPPVVSHAVKRDPTQFRATSGDATSLDESESRRSPTGKIRSISSVADSRFGRNVGAHATSSSRASTIAWNQQPQFENSNDAPASQFADRLGADINSDNRGTALQRIDVESRQLSNVSESRSQNQSNLNQTKLKQVSQPKRWHRIARFDTLNELSKKYYGSDEFALHIFEANRGTLVSPAILPIGTELIIPATSAIHSAKRPQTEPVRRSREQPERLRVEPMAPIGSMQGWRRSQTPSNGATGL